MDTTDKKLSIALLSALGVLLLLAVSVVAGLTARADAAVLLAVHRSAPVAAVQAADVISKVADVPAVLLVGAVLGLVLAKRDRLTALRIFVAVWAASLSTTILKQVVHRPRPELWHTIVNETNWSFPSGHATASSALAAIVVVSLWQTRWRTLAVVAGGLFMLAVGLSRMVLGVHYASDVLAGWTVGIACAFAARRYITAKLVNRG